MNSRGNCLNSKQTDFVVEADYVTSDLHFNHENIVNPDSKTDSRSGDLQRLLNQDHVSVGDMNEFLISRWNETVSETDEVVILGDFSIGKSPHSPDEIYERLEGQKTYVMGDHDIYRGKLDIPEEAEPENLDNLNYWGIIETEEDSYLATHFPDRNQYGVPGGNISSRIEPNLPENLYNKWTGYKLAGHHHNNWLDNNNRSADYPFIHPAGRANVSIELTDYRPVSLDKIEKLLQSGEKVENLTNQKSGIGKVER